MMGKPQQWEFGAIDPIESTVKKQGHKCAQLTFSYMVQSLNTESGGSLNGWVGHPTPFHTTKISFHRHLLGPSPRWL